MIVISKASPIKFWQSGNTYNQGIDNTPGVMDATWLQKWNANDSIPLQFYDTELKDYRLRCYDVDGELIAEKQYSRELLNDLYIYSTTLEFETDFSVTDQIVSLKIVDVYAEITGALTDTMEQVGGDIIFVDASMNSNLDGGLSDTIEQIGGDVIHSQSDDFGTSSTVESGACTFDTVLYWEMGVTWGTGVTMYTDAARTTPLTGEDFISLDGEIYNINSATGVVGTSTGIFC